MPVAVPKTSMDSFSQTGEIVARRRPQSTAKDHRRRIKAVDQKRQDPAEFLGRVINQADCFGISGGGGRQHGLAGFSGAIGFGKAGARRDILDNAGADMAAVQAMAPRRAIGNNESGPA